MGRIKLSLLLVLFISTLASAQKDSIRYEYGGMGLVSTGEYAPFWLQTNRHGVVSAQPTSSNIFASISKQVDKKPFRFDYGFDVSPMLQFDATKTEVFFQNIYLNAKLYIFDFVAGIKPIEMGNHDKELSSGGFLFSPNARPLPRISLGIDDYFEIPFTAGNLAIKGGLTHGWFADNIYIEGALLHYKFIGARLGGGSFPLSLNYEFHHVAQWGGNSPVHGDLGNGFRDYINAFFARAGGSMPNDQINAQGNHIGSQQVGLKLNTHGWESSLYWQNIFEDSPIKVPWKSMNLPDGLYGLSISQNHFKPVRKFVYEYLETTDQSGPTHDIDGLVFGGGDNYFRNGIYQNGWNHYFRTIGIPFITSPIYNENPTQLQTLNTRTQVHYFALAGEIAKIDYRAIFSTANNYGRYGAPTFNQNKALLIEAHRRMDNLWGIDVGLALAADWGTQFGNGFGTMLSIKKQGLLLKW